MDLSSDSSAFVCLLAASAAYPTAGTALTRGPPAGGPSTGAPASTRTFLGGGSCGKVDATVGQPLLQRFGVVLLGTSFGHSFFFPLQEYIAQKDAAQLVLCRKEDKY